jgi:hypothetical protein
MMLWLLADTSTTGNVLMAVAVVLLIVLVVANGRRQQKRRDQDKALAPQEKLERMRQTNQTRNDLRQMMVELEELTRRFSAQLDAKSRRLERLLDEADQKIAELNEATAPEGDPVHQIGDNPDRPSRKAPAGPPDPGGPRVTVNRNDPTRPPRVMGGKSAANGDTGVDDQSDAHQPDVLSQRIFQMSDAGRSSIEIARDLDEQVGKVELILALREGQQR